MAMKYCFMSNSVKWKSTGIGTFWEHIFGIWNYRAFSFDVGFMAKCVFRIWATQTKLPLEKSIPFMQKMFAQSVVKNLAY